MGRHYRIFFALSIAVPLAACAGPSAIESQSRLQDSRMSRLYFLREKALIGALGGTVPAADIKVDGKKVGAVTNGSYFFVDRPPGLHQLSAENGVSLAYETEVQVEASKSYYFNLGTPGSGKMGQDLLNQTYAGGSGRQMRPQSVLSGFSGVAFYSLDPVAGAAEIERLKAP